MFAIKLAGEPVLWGRLFLVFRKIYMTWDMWTVCAFVQGSLPPVKVGLGLQRREECPGLGWRVGRPGKAISLMTLVRLG